MIDVSRAEYLSVRLMLAYLEPDRDLRPAYVLAVESESGLTPEVFDIANLTAWSAAQYWWVTDPDLGRRLLCQRLEAMTGVPA